MKTVFFMPFILLLGLVIGGWAPKEELRAVRKEINALNAKFADQDKTQRFDTITRIAQIPDRATLTKQRMAPLQPGTSSSVKAIQTNDVAARLSVSVASASNTAAKTSEQPKEPTKPEDLRARIDEAKELWMTRVEIARAQWLQRLKLSQDDTAKFDDAINAMNENLFAAMQNLADVVTSESALTPETGARAFNEMTSALVQTYDEINAVIPPEMQSEAEKIELTDFIDPAIAEPLVAVQDKLGNLPQEHRPGMRLRR